MREFLPEFRELRPDHDRAIALPRVSRVIVLMIVLGRPVIAVERHDLRDDRLAEHLFALELGNHVERRVALRIRMREHDRPVLRADVVALPVQRGRIVRREEDLEDLAIADARRIERHVDDFRVAGVAFADVAIARVARMAARITRLNGRHAVDVEKHGLRAPETPASERRGFKHLVPHEISPSWMTAAGTPVPAPSFRIAATRPRGGRQRHFVKYLTRARNWQIGQGAARAPPRVSRLHLGTRKRRPTRRVRAASDACPTPMPTSSAGTSICTP
ncbi:hypothetical protein BCEN4_1190029 [Burkholderia cenocepacia]|nr:hypothetical protein BCEN4_1190029 [Burkholderia cenocepacia]